MRRTLLGATGALLLTSAVLAVPASAKPVPVDGDRFEAAGLTARSQGCADRRATPVEPPAFEVRRGPGNAPIGDHSAGWQITGGEFGAGWTAPVTRPQTLKTFRIRANSPGGEGRGVAIVYFHPDGDSGFWFGSATLPADTETGWHAVNAAGLSYAWTHYTSNDVVDRTSDAQSIQEFVAEHGGNGDGAELGFLFGCDQNLTFVDQLELVTANQDRVFDFGGTRTRTQARVGESTPAKLVLRFGYQLRIGGTVHEKFGGQQIGASVKFDARPASGGKWRTVGKDTSGPDGRASILVTPKESTVYRMRYDGSDSHEGSGAASDTLRIVLRDLVSARILDRTVTKGRPFTVVGQVKPGQKKRFLLQRFVGGRWKTIGKGMSQGDGDLRISATARDTGRSYYRIRTANAGGTLGNVSKNLELRVAAPPSSGGGGGNPPPPPTDDPEPPPPPPDEPPDNQG